MSARDAAYLVFGLTLVGALLAIAAHYFSRKRKERVERAKYRMLDDGE